MPRLHSSSPSSLAGECKKAGKILDSFVNPKVFTVDQTIPRPILAQARGIAILTIPKTGMMGSTRVGAGLVAARLPNGTWSSPSAITTGSLAVGQFGTDVTDFVFVFTTDTPVDTLSRTGSLSLGRNGNSIAPGPFGRSADTLTTPEAAILAYSRTRGLFGGFTLEGAVLGERADVNKKIYNGKVSAHQLLAGHVTSPPPPETLPLVSILSSDLFRVTSAGLQPGSLQNQNQEHRRGQSRVRAPQLPSFELQVSPPVSVVPVPPVPPKTELAAVERPTPELDASDQSVFELPALHPREGMHELSSDERVPTRKVLKKGPPSIPRERREGRRRGSPRTSTQGSPKSVPTSASTSPTHSPLPSPFPSPIPGKIPDTPTTPAEDVLDKALETLEKEKPPSPPPKRLSRIPTLLMSGRGSPPKPPKPAKPAESSPKRIARMPTVLTIGRAPKETGQSKWSRHDPLPF